jgi:hypothetical protein
MRPSRPLSAQVAGVGKWGRCNWTRDRDLTGLFIAWGLWAALTVALLLYVRQYSRNVPYMDDFELIPVMTGSEPVSLQWAWAQHNEHRPMISRLIMAGLTRFVANDFRAPRYANVVLLSAMAAAMLVLARTLRGSTRLVDAILPLAILNVAQAECLMIGFAMNLILTSLLAIAMIAAVSLADRLDGRAMALLFGLMLILLPLTGGGGLALVPPLALWLAGYVGWGWWSEKRPGITSRAIGLALLMACSAIVGLYLLGYVRPPHHPRPPSATVVAFSIVRYLSLAVYPRITSYWWPAGLIVAVLMIATLRLLAIASLHSPGERTRAFGLVSIILSMLSVACTVGYSRAGLGLDRILASRYVTLTIPLLCVVYIVWLTYGKTRARALVHVGLLVLICATLPEAYRTSRAYGRSVRVAEERVERGLKQRVATEQLLAWTCPAIYPEPRVVRKYFIMLRHARIGAFAYYEDDRSRRF